MDNLDVVNQWIERYGCNVSIYNDTVYKLSSIYFDPRYFPLNDAGLVQLCWFTLRHFQDIYRDLPKL
jgi:hypothetical protein